MMMIHVFINSLFSTESASVFYTEDDDLRSWFYSKYLVEQERQEHIKRLREQGINVPEEDLADADRGPYFLCSVSVLSFAVIFVLFFLFSAAILD